MPVYLSVPLPGPFRRGRRLGRWHHVHRGRFRQPLYWLSFVWTIELCFWLVAAAVRVILVAGTWAWRRWCGEPPAV